MKEVLITERVSQSKEIGIVVNTDTGEIVNVPGDHGSFPASYTRNIRSRASQHKKLSTFERHRTLRNLTGIDDVRNEDDLLALLGEVNQYDAWITGCGLELLHSPDNGLSKRAINLAIMLALKTLTARNYALVSNDEIKALINDQSGNYSKYLQELQSINFCKVRSVSKIAKLITINPVYSYRGYRHPDDKTGLRLTAIAKYYGRPSYQETMNHLLRQSDENEWLEAA